MSHSVCVMCGEISLDRLCEDCADDVLNTKSPHSMREDFDEEYMGNSNRREKQARRKKAIRQSDDYEEDSDD